MADLTVSTVTRTGVTLPAGALLVDSTNTFDNDGKTMLHLVGSTATVTFTATAQKDLPLDDASADKTLAVTSTSDFLWGPFPTVWFNNLSGKVSFTTSDAVGNVTASVISVLDDFN